MASLLPVSPAQADDRPLWEIGVAGGGAYVPDYPAASHSQLTGIALPYAIYRGEFLRADQDGVRSEVDLSNRLEFQLSVDASFSADSEDNDERRGLPDLDYLVELGPSLEYRLWSQGAQSLTAVAQARAAFAVNLDRFDYVGIAVEPQVIFRNRNVYGRGLELTVGFGPKFAFDGLNDYFYTVDSQFATPTRSAYSAKAGYQQSAISTALYYPVTPRLSVAVLNQLLFTGGAANDGSPLFRHNFNYAIGAGLAYSLFVSEARAR